jgi:hypothetical protein
VVGKYIDNTMKDIVESIKKTNYSELHDVKCVKEYKIERKTGGMTFKQGEEYEASKINDNWWLIEQFGVSSEDFKKYFKDI